MKKLITSIFVLSLLFISCKEKVKEEKAKEVEEAVIENKEIVDGMYMVNTKTSVLNWKGYKPTGTHNGTILIKAGFFSVKGEGLTTGKFEFDMNTISVLDIPEDDESNAKLKGHLKSGDFFDVVNNPTSTFEIVEVNSNNNETYIKGILTIKGIAKSIEFPVSLVSTDAGVKLTSNAFKIDRTEFDIRFKSQKFFNDLKDQFINDEFEISFEINASK